MTNLGWELDKDDKSRFGNSSKDDKLSVGNSTKLTN